MTTPDHRPAGPGPVPAHVRDPYHQAQYAIATILAGVPAMADAAPEILRAVCEHLGWDMGTFWVLDEDDSRLRYFASWRRPEIHAPSFGRMTRETTFPVGAGFPGRVVDTRQPAWITDAAREPGLRRAAAARTEGIHGAFALPVTAGERVLGVMEFFSSHPRDPDPTLLMNMATVGSQVGQYLVRQRVEDEVRLQRALLRSASEATVDGILVVAPDRSILWHNRRFADLWGIPGGVLATGSDREALGAVRDILVDPDGFLERVEALYADPAAEGRDEILLRDGRVLDRWTAPVMADDGSISGRAWYFRDITDHKRVETVLTESRERHSFITGVIAAVSSSLDLATVAERLAGVVVPRMGEWSAVHLVDPGGYVVQVATAHADPSRAGLAARAQGFGVRLEGETPVTAALESGTLQLVTGMTAAQLERWSEDESHLQALTELGARSVLVLPLRGRGRTLGTLSLWSADPDRPYDDDDLSLARIVAMRAALAVDNAMLHSERSHIARTLQESLLPPVLPDIPEIELAAVYRPGGEGIDVAGDFYDVFPAGKRSWALVVGDVCGKGVEAASMTSLARYAIRTAATETTRPGGVLQRVNAAILGTRTDQRYCTVACALIHPRRSSTNVLGASAGHPLPLLVSPRGTIRALGAPGTMLGVFPDPEITSFAVELSPGDLVVWYTDGVTDARRGTELFGEERLRDALRQAAGGSAEDAIRSVERAVLGFVDEAPHDDIAVLALRYLS